MGSWADVVVYSALTVLGGATSMAFFGPVWATVTAVLIVVVTALVFRAERRYQERRASTSGEL